MNVNYSVLHPKHVFWWKRDDFTTLDQGQWLFLPKEKKYVSSSDIKVHRQRGTSSIESLFNFNKECEKDSGFIVRKAQSLQPAKYWLTQQVD